MSDGLSVRDERVGDHAAIRDLTAAAFAASRYGDNGEAGIIETLRAAGALTLSLVAERGGRLCGQVTVSPVEVGAAVTGWYGIGPVAVTPAAQGRGIGAALMRAAVGRLEEMRAAGCVLVGDPGYYGRFGFFADGRVRYGDVPVAYVLRLVLAGPDAAGDVRYHAAFGG